MAKQDAENEKQPTFEEALTQLESIVSAIEEGKIGLEASITEYEKGMRLIRYCRSILADAEGKIQQLQATDDGGVSTGPVEPPASQ